MSDQPLDGSKPILTTVNAIWALVTVIIFLTYWGAQLQANQQNDHDRMQRIKDHFSDTVDKLYLKMDKIDDINSRVIRIETKLDKR